MKPAPANWPRISSALFYEEAAQAIDWLVRAFGFEVRLKIVDDEGRIAHSELVYGEGLIMVAEANAAKGPNRRSPRSIGGGTTQSLMLYVDDVETHCAQARVAGATVTQEPATTDYGDDFWSDRSYECVDLEGHRWWISQRLRDPRPV